MAELNSKNIIFKTEVTIKTTEDKLDKYIENIELNKIIYNQYTIGNEYSDRIISIQIEDEKKKNFIINILKSLNILTENKIIKKLKKKKVQEINIREV